MKTVVITGATSGIGLAVAKQLANEGFRVIVVGRHQDRCDQARQAVLAAAPEAAVVSFTADLMQQPQVNHVAEEINAYLAQHSDGKLLALINNAGCARGYYMTTEDGYEQQFALNYLAGFLLTCHLLPAIQKAGGRVLMTCSESHKGTRVHWQDVMLSHRYNPLTAYKQSKLCDILLVKGLNDRLAGQGVRAYAIDPGLVHTDIGNKDAGGLVSLIWNLRKVGGISPDEAAATYTYLCCQPDAPDGLYYRQCQKYPYSKQVTSENAAKLLALSQRLCGVSCKEA